MIGEVAVVRVHQVRLRAILADTRETIAGDCSCTFKTCLRKTTFIRDT